MKNQILCKENNAKLFNKQSSESKLKQEINVSNLSKAKQEIDVKQTS